MFQKDMATMKYQDESTSMLPPSLCLLPTQSSATVSAETSRASSRLDFWPPLEFVQFVSISWLRASSVEERPGEDSADPDWDEEVDDAGKERGDDDPEYDPEAKQKTSRPLK